MKKFSIYLMILAAVLAAGCNKVAETGPAAGIDEFPEGAMEFKVRIDGSGTKSHLADPTATGHGDVSNLVWDAGDMIAVYAVKLIIQDGQRVGADFANCKNCLAKVKPSTINGGSASFYAMNVDEDWWISDEEEDENSIYAMMAVYIPQPASGTTPTADDYKMQVWARMEDDDDFMEMFSPLLPVPALQDGKSYNNYQILLDMELEDLFTHKQLAERSKPIVFHSFSPSTTLLHFKLVSGFDSAIENVKSIKVSLKQYISDDESMGGYWDYTNSSAGEWVNFPRKIYYGQDYFDGKVFGMAGVGVFSYFMFGGDLSDRASYSLFALNGGYLSNLTADSGEYYSDDLTAQNTIVLAFDEPVTIPATLADAEEFYVVTTSLAYRVIGYEGTAVVLFEACDASDNVVAVAEKTMPEGGFTAGSQYNFNLAMGRYAEMTGQDAGSYDGIVELNQ